MSNLVSLCNEIPLKFLLHPETTPPILFLLRTRVSYPVVFATATKKRWLERFVNVKPEDLSPFLASTQTQQLRTSIFISSLKLRKKNPPVEGR